MNRPLVTVDVWFDLICPWCLIGKRQMEQAQAEFVLRHPDAAVELRWHSLQLLGDLPEEGVDFREFYRHRLGSDAAVTARQAQVREAAGTVGEIIAFDRIQRMPNTLAAHGLVADARAQGGEAAAQVLVEALFSAYFQQGVDIGDPDMLACIAERHGIEPAEQRPELPSTPRVNGVPFFVFNGRIGLSGAQPAQQLLDAMEQAIAAPAETVAAH